MTAAHSTPLLLTSHQLALQGLASWQRSRAVDRLELERVRRGVYANADEWAALDDLQRFVARAQAASLTRSRPLLFSHVTAAILTGLPLVERIPPRLEFLRIGATGGRSQPGLLAHRSPDHDAGRSAAGVMCTTVERTLVDVAATSSLRRSLVMLDAALQRGLTSTPELLMQIDARTSLRARQRATRFVSLADAHADSPGESISRADFVADGLQMPESQVEFDLPGGKRARVDFFWPSIGLVGEFDGRLKYGRADGTGDVDALWREKQREDALRSLGLRVVRWTWNDAWQRTPLTRMLVQAGVPRG